MSAVYQKLGCLNVNKMTKYLFKYMGFYIKLGKYIEANRKTIIHNPPSEVTAENILVLFLKTSVHLPAFVTKGFIVSFLLGQ